MAEITIAGNTYGSYASVAEADEYLAADLPRYAAWAALSADMKGRALVTATRYLLGLAWVGGIPDLDTPPAAVVEATALFAADIAAKPALANDASTGSNVKRVKGGEAEVEFFRPTTGAALPPYLLRLLGSLLGTDVTWGEGGTAYGSEDCRESRFDRTDWRLNESYS
jgi:hypothetical protein